MSSGEEKQTATYCLHRRLGAASLPVTLGVNLHEILVQSLLCLQGIIQLVVLRHELLQHTLSGRDGGEEEIHHVHNS